MNTKIFFIFLFLFFSVASISKAQNSPVMYFCERYDPEKGEININDRFHKGNITVMIKCDYEIGLKSVHIEFDKLDSAGYIFKFYKEFNFTINPSMKYVYFSQNDESDMSLNEPGFYRVLLLDDKDNIAASAMVQIID